MKTTALAEAIRTAQGDKGGASTPRTPIEAPDSLKSTSFAHILDLISEGPIYGLVNGLKSVYYDETPLQNEDDSFNFKDVQFDMRLGTQDQEYMEGFSGVDNAIAVNFALLYGTPYTYTTTNIQLSALRVQISTPAMSKSDTTTGDINGYSIAYAIDVKTDGGSYIEVFTSAMTGKTTSKYERSHRINLPKAVTGWTLRVRRLTPDANNAQINDLTFVDNVTEIVDGKFRYPNSAYAGHHIDAEQFPSIPSRAFHCKGLITSVPTNYNPDTRVYTGLWDGTFKQAYTNNPAWCYYALVTSTRFGVGRAVNPAEINKWELYRIGQYCDELVPDGFGGEEPRFTCNAYLQTREEAYKTLQNIASIFRGMVYWGMGAVQVAADMPADPVYLYTPANVINGKFMYGGSSKRARHTTALVVWNDMTDFCRQKTEYVEDKDGIARYGINPIQTVAFGCTSRAQARRIGKWMLASERIETDSVSWSVGIEGVIAAPGQYVAISDPLRAGTRLGGRITGSSTTYARLDSWPVPAPAVGEFIHVISSAGTSKKLTITGVVAGSQQVNFAAQPDASPNGSMWILERASIVPEIVRVMSVIEDKTDGGLQFTITGIQHREDKYDYVDFGDPLEDPPTVAGTPPVQVPPASVTLTTNARVGHVVSDIIVTASWPKTANAQKYRVSWRHEAGEWTPPQTVTGQTAALHSAFAGEYVCKVTAVGQSGSSVPVLSAVLDVPDLTQTPGFVEALEDAIADAMDTALDAKDIADGAIVSYYQTSPPTGASEGDIWFDTDAGNKIYTYRSGSWVATPDSDIAAALAAAATAQATADGKVKTFFQTTAPAATGVGDLWMDTDDGNKLYRWNGSTWQVAQDTGIAASLTAALNAQAAADGKITSFWQSSPPTIGSGTGQAKVGDIWFDTDDGNKVYRVVGSSWVVAADDDMAAALSAATNAQATADGKVQTYFSSTTPTASAVGDLWFNTTSSQLFRWNGSTWTQNIGDVTAAQLAGDGTNLIWDQYSRFAAAPLPTTTVSAGAPAAVWDADHTIGVGGSLKTTTATTALAEGYYLGSSVTDYNVLLPPGKYIVSAYVKVSVAGHLVRLGLKSNDGGTVHNGTADLPVASANAWTRVSFALDLTSKVNQTAVLPLLYSNRSQVAGRTVRFDGLMIERQIGTQTLPSVWMAGLPHMLVANAIAAAAAAQDTADGKIETFFQTTMPVGTLGDLWFDTDDGNKMYRHNGTTFVVAQDTAIGDAILAAAGAQATADGRVTTFYAASAPTANATGDLWYDTSTTDLKRWNGSAWIKVGDVTLGQLAGTGQNLIWGEYAVLTKAQTLSSATLPAVGGGAGGGTNTQAVADAAAVNGFSYQVTSTTAVAGGDFFRLYDNSGTGNLNLTNKKYIVSFFAKASVAGHTIRPAFRGVVSRDGVDVALTTARVRYSQVIDFTDQTVDFAEHLLLFTNRSAVIGRTVNIDGVMVEPMLGNLTTPSAFVAGPSTLATDRAIANAALAQAAADGKIESFYQTSPPGTASEGDLWFDTDDGNKIYTRRSGSWVLTQDSAIGAAITAAAGAQATADGRVSTFYQSGTPTANAVGDLWYNTQSQVLTRWNGSTWTTTGDNSPKTEGPNLVPNSNFASNAVGTANGAMLSAGDMVCDGWVVNAVAAQAGASVRYLTAGYARLYYGNDTLAAGVLSQSTVDSLKSFPVEPGKTYKVSLTTSGSSFNVSNLTNIDIRVRVNARFYDVTGAQIAGGTGYQEVVVQPSRSSATTSADVVAPATAVAMKVELSLYIKNNGATLWTPNNSVTADIRFGNVTVTRRLDMDTEVLDGTNYWRTSSTDLYSSGGFNRIGLRVPGSGHRVGDQRNLLRSLTSAYGMVRTTTALSATSAGAVTVNAHTVRYGGYSVSYNAVSNAVTGLTQGSTYVIYCTDATLSGGTKTYFAGTDPATVMNISDDIYVVGQITIPTSGSSSGGGGGTGGNPGDWCVAVESFMPDGTLAADVYKGKMIPCYNNQPENPNIHHWIVQDNELAEAECLRLVTESGASIIASVSTPMTLRDGRLVFFPDMLHRHALVYRYDGTFQWEEVVALEPVGVRPVARIHVHQQCYFAGETKSAFIATHNNLKP